MVNKIEPYKFQRSTNIQEHNDMVSKINETIEVVNGIEVDELKETVAQLQDDVSSNTESISDINREMETQDARIETLEDDSATKGGQIADLQNTVGQHDDDISDIHATDEIQNNDITTLKNRAIKSVSIRDGVGFGYQIFQLDEEDGTPITSNNYNLKLPQDLTLKMAEGKAFYCEMTLNDGTVRRSNDLLIEGVVADGVYISSFTFRAGSEDGFITADIGLSNGTTITANDFPVPVPVGIEENITTLQQQMNDVLTKLGQIEGVSVVISKPTVNTIVNVANGQQTGAPVDIIGNLELTNSDNVMTIRANGKTGTANVIENASISSMDNTLALSVNGKGDTTQIINSIDGEYDSKTKNLHIEVNGRGVDINFPLSDGGKGIVCAMRTGTPLAMGPLSISNPKPKITKLSTPISISTYSYQRINSSYQRDDYINAKLGDVDVLILPAYSSSSIAAVYYSVQKTKPIDLEMASILEDDILIPKETEFKINSGSISLPPGKYLFEFAIANASSTSISWDNNYWFANCTVKAIITFEEGVNDYEVELIEDISIPAGTYVNAPSNYSVINAIWLYMMVDTLERIE